MNARRTLTSLGAVLALTLSGAAFAQTAPATFDSPFGTPWNIGSGTPTFNPDGTASFDDGESVYTSFSAFANGPINFTFNVMGAGEGRSRIFRSSDVGIADFSNPVAFSGATATEVTTFTGPTTVTYTLDGVAGESYHLYVSGFGSGMTIGDVSVIAAPVPEPESYAMMFAGLGVLGFMGRRRKTA